MPSHKIVVRYRDGHLLKGTTSNFNPIGRTFILVPMDQDKHPDPIEVHVEKLKAVFFVRDFAGNPGRKERTTFEEHQTYAGREVEVVFKDGEKMIGSTPSYSPDMQGFFVFPVDTESNTLKVFAVNAGVSSVRLLTKGQRSGGDRRSGMERRRTEHRHDGPDKRTGADRRSGADRRGRPD